MIILQAAQMLDDKIFYKKSPRVGKLKGFRREKQKGAACYLPSCSAESAKTSGDGT